jgi:hypothetical protein
MHTATSLKSFFFLIQIVALSGTVICLLVVALALPAQAPKPFDAFVFEKSGNWKLGKQLVDSRTGLHFGDVLRLDTASTKSGSITIIYINGDIKSCSDQEKRIDCEVKPAARLATNLLERVFASVREAVVSDSQSVPGLAKSAAILDGYGELDEGILFIHVPGLSAKALALRLQFRRMNQAGQVGPPILVNSPWNQGSPLDAPGISPGFYRVNVLDSDSRPTGDFFLLLVFKEGSSGTLSEDFNALLARTNTWGQHEQGTALIVRRLFLWQKAKDMKLMEEN